MSNFIYKNYDIIASVLMVGLAMLVLSLVGCAPMGNAHKKSASKRDVATTFEPESLGAAAEDDEPAEFDNYLEDVVLDKNGGVPGTGVGGSLDENQLDASNPNANKIDSFKAFNQSLRSVTAKNCSMCHSGAATPKFAQEDPELAHEALVKSGKVDLSQPEKSRLYERLADDAHNCWGDCAANAQEMLEGIKKWAELSYVAQGPDLSKVTQPRNLAQAVAGEPPEPDPLTIVMEAETGVATGNMSMTASDNASGGFVVGSPGDQNLRTPRNSRSGADSVTFTVNVQQAGSYRLFARTTAAADANNSIFVSINQGNFANYTLPVTGDGEFEWSAANNGEDEELPAVDLTPGPQTVEFRRREAGAALDIIALSADPGFTGDGLSLEKDIKVLTFDASTICGAPGVTFEIEVRDLNDTSYQFKNPKMTSQTASLQVKGINVWVNNRSNNQYVTYKLVDKLVEPGEKVSLEENGALIVLKENGPAQDTFAFSFESCAAP